ncbi:MAG: thiol-disulfide oxidoreductase [Phycisphaerales bacterium]|nr:thiol-disulfide oxidoreductase [Phycisphaerales bacterium]
MQLLFDGLCGLCDRSVDFIIRHDRHHRFTFSPLQSPAGQAAIRRAGLTEQYFDSIVLIDGNTLYTHSDAVLNIARRLGWPWKLVYGLILIPRPLRDWGYRFIARHRYQWFGKREACRIPTPAERAQFVVDVDEPAAQPAGNGA